MRITPTYQSTIFQVQSANSNREINRNTKAKSYHSETQQLKQLLSNSVGDCIKFKPIIQFDVNKEYKSNKLQAQQNQLSYLQSNIFNDQPLEIRNDKEKLKMHKSKQLTVTEEIRVAPKTKTRGTLLKEIYEPEKRNSLDQQQSCLFDTLASYYTTKRGIKPNFMPNKLSFLNHDTIRNRGLEREEEVQNKLFDIQKLSKTTEIQKQIESSQKQQDTESIKPKTPTPKKQFDSYLIQVNEKSYSFAPRYFSNFCKSNGYDVTIKEGDQYILKPNIKNEPNLNSILNYLKNNQNGITVFKSKIRQRTIQ